MSDWRLGELHCEESQTPRIVESWAEFSPGCCEPSLSARHRGSMEDSQSKVLTNSPPLSHPHPGATLVQRGEKGPHPATQARPEAGAGLEAQDLRLFLLLEASLALTALTAPAPAPGPARTSQHHNHKSAIL